MKYPFVVLSLCNALIMPQFIASTLHGGQNGATANPEQESGNKKSTDAVLEQMVITATRVAEPTKDIPASVQVITQEDIKSSSARDAGELMAEAGIGHVHKYNGALTGNVEIRGLSTDLFTETNSRVLVLVNGNRAGTTNLAKIPSGEIERIEIVKGPGSVLYGSQAMGGVINIITKQGKEGFHGSVGAEGGSWGYWKTGGDVSGKKYGIDYFISGGVSSSDDYQTPRGTYQNTSYETEEFSTRFGYSFLDDHRVSVGFQRWVGRNIGSPGATYAPDPDDYSKKARNAFDFEYQNKTTTLKYYISNNKDDSYSTGGMGTPGPGNSDRFTSNTRSQGGGIQNVFPIGVHRIILGGQWDRTAVDTSSSSGAPYYPDSLYDNYAVFAEGRGSLLDEKLLLTAGIRYDYFDNNTLTTPGLTASPISRNMDHVTARGGIVYKVIDGLSLKAAIGTAFRAPSPLELASDYTLYGYRTLGNQNLSPEKSITYEGGFEYAKNHIKGGFTFFHTDFSNKIASYYDSALSATTYKNLSGATIQGVEMNASYVVGLAAGLDMSIEPFANATCKTRYDSGDPSLKNKSGGRLMYVPGWTGAFGVKAGQEKWDGKLIINYSGDEYVTDYSASYPYPVVNKGGFMTMDIKGACRPLRNLELTFSVQNLLDRECEYIKGYPMAGRTFTGGAKWLF